MRIGNHSTTFSYVFRALKKVPSKFITIVANCVRYIRAKIQDAHLSRMVYKCLGLRACRPAPPSPKPTTKPDKTEPVPVTPIATETENSILEPRTTMVKTYAEDIFTPNIRLTTTGHRKLIYRMGERVLKVPRSTRRESFTREKAQQLVDRWNTIFATIYSGKFAHYASAAPIRIECNDGSVTFGLDVPYLKDEKDLMNSHDERTLERELYQAGFSQYKDNTRENSVFQDGHWLPIDMDFILP